jgi:hypothetical protein
MKTLIPYLVKALVTEVAAPILKWIGNYVSTKIREFSRKKSVKKHDKSNDPKDLLDLEDKLNNK